jgi:DNA topoisomerase-1
MQYCYDITSVKDIPVNELKDYVQSIYINKKFGENAFDKDEIPPFVVIYTKENNRVCISLTTRGKKNIQKIEAIHKNLKDSDLIYKGIQMSRPYIFGTDINKWWEEDRDPLQQTTHRWSSLVHRGPYFTHIMEPYESLGSRLIYKNKAYTLAPIEERVLSFYAKRKISEEKGGVVDMLTKDVVFNTNYFNDLKNYLSEEHLKIFNDFSKFDFSDIITKIVEKTETEVSAKDTEAKRNKKIKIEERKMEYGYAVLDGVRERVGNFIIEPAAIFYGRGNNPKRGKIKPDINPEEVVINIGPHDPVPRPPDGHNWKEVVTDQNSVWLSKWRDPTTESTKYIMFSTEGRFKGESDLAKYEKARKLNKYIDKIREKYKKDINSDDVVKKQLGTVLYLIDNFGIRVGNEKEEDEADTVGATTLRVNHVNTVTQNHIIFDFLGKDSVRFFKDLIIPPVIYKNILSFQKGKKPDDDLFDRISSDDINTYLKQFDSSFSAKVFRTRLASNIMFHALQEVKIPKDSTKVKIKNAFNEANSEVANILNHTRNVPKKTEEKIQKLRDELKELKLKKGEERKIVTLTEKIDAMSNVMNVAITTSLNNYIDPRLVVAWAKTENIPIEFIYSGTLMKKFDWAISSTEKEWNYVNTPLVGEQTLKPSEHREKHKSPQRTRKLREKEFSQDEEPLRYIDLSPREESRNIVELSPHEIPHIDINEPRHINLPQYEESDEDINEVTIPEEFVKIKTQKTKQTLEENVQFMTKTKLPHSKKSQKHKKQKYVHKIEFQHENGTNIIKNKAKQMITEIERENIKQKDLIEREKYMKEIPRDIRKGLETLKYYGKDVRKSTGNENIIDYSNVEQKHYERLSEICKEKPFRPSVLLTFPAYIKDFFVPYAIMAYKRGIITEFGNALIKYHVEKISR